MSATLYTTDILRLATSTAGFARLDAPDGSAERRSPVCGSRVSADVRLDGAGTVAEIGMEVRACALGQASSALMAASVKGASLPRLEQVTADLRAFLSGTSEALPDWPGMEIFTPARAYPARHAAILIPFEAVSAAVAAAR